MISLCDDKQAVLLALLTLHPDIWMIFSTLIMFIYFANMVSQIYPSELMPLIQKLWF